MSLSKNDYLPLFVIAALGAGVAILAGRSGILDGHPIYTRDSFSTLSPGKERTIYTF